MSPWLRVASIAFWLFACCDYGDARTAFKYPVEQNAPCPSGVTISTVDKDTIRFCGFISEETVNETIGAFQQGSKSQLLIDSFGGETAAAIRLDRYLREQDITLLVQNICLSACSQFVLLGAPQVAFRSHSVVGMHDSQLSTNILVGEQRTDPAARAEAELELAYYQELDIPAELLTVPTGQLEPRCIIGFGEVNDIRATNVMTRFDFYVPDAVYFEEIYPGEALSDFPDGETVAAFWRDRKIGSTFRFVHRYPIELPLESLPMCAE